MHAFVTGATGFLGNNLIRLLLAQGHQVTGLVRSRSKAAALLGDLPVNLVEGDLTNVAAFADALQGCDTLFHTAAFFREYFQPGDHWATLEQLNVHATIQLLEAAAKHGLQKVVHTSSSGVIGMRAGETWGDESDLPDAHALENLYFRSKVYAEREIARFLATNSLDVVMVLPGWMFGPGDAAPTSSGQIVQDFLQKKLPGIIPGGGAPVDVRDVAQGMLLAAQHGKRGERYIVGGDTWVPFSTLFSVLEQVSKVTAPTMPLPLPVVMTVAFIAETWGRITGQPVLMTRTGIRTLLHQRTTRSAKAIRELGITFRPLEETLRDEVAWYRSEPGKSQRVALLTT
jgi:dihydroflavonol-4-reductase